MKRRLAAILPAVAMAALAVPMATPAAAHADCGTGASDKDGGSWGKWADGADERGGSSTSCGINGVACSPRTPDHHCCAVGNDGCAVGNDGCTWTFARNVDTGQPGWIHDDVLPDGGSYVYCGF